MERQEQLLDMRTRILQAEEDRLHGARTVSIAETREALKRMPASINAGDRFKDRESRENDGVEDFSSPSKV